MKRKVGLLVSAIVVGVSLYFAFSNRPNNAIETAVDSQNKEHVIAYQFEIHTTGLLNSGVMMSALFNSPINAPLQPIEETLSGTLLMQSIPSQMKKIVQLKALKGVDPEIESELAKAVLVEQTEEGSFRLDESEFTYSDPQRDLLLNLLSKIQVVWPEHPVDDWQTVEKDNIGTYHAKYQQKDKQPLLRTKKEYVDVQAQSQAMFDLPNTTLSILESSETLSFLVNSKQIDSVTSIQKIELKQTTERVLELTQSVSLTSIPIDADVGQTLTLNDVRLQYQQTHPSIASKKEVLGIGLDSSEELVSWFSKALAEDEDKAIDQLTLWLSGNPAQVGELINYMNAHLADISDEVDLRIWYAMTQSGSVEAQIAFADAMSNSSYDILIRTRAIVYSHDFARPTQDLIDGLWKVYEHKLTDSSKDENELSSMALYALGSLINAKDVTKTLQDTLSKAMLFRLETVTNEEQLSEVLTALSNTRMSRFINAIEKQTANTNDRVALAAFEALANLELPAATDAIVDKLDRIKSAAMRETATKFLVNAAPTDKSILWASNALQASENQSEQSHLIQYLGKYAQDYPNAQESLKKLLEQPGLTLQQKRLIYRYVSPQH